jgi:hypothetical protein
VGEETELEAPKRRVQASAFQQGNFKKTTYGNKDLEINSLL